MFSVHMGQHMVLNMLVPILLVLGGPVTLLLRALPAGGRRSTSRARGSGCSPRSTRRSPGC